MSAGSAPDQFLIGLAVLGLLSDVAEEQPLVCLIDDQQWLDPPRRRSSPSLPADWGERSASSSRPGCPGSELAGLPELVVSGLPEGGRAGAAGLGTPGLAGRAGARSDRRRDPRQPAGAAGAATRADVRPNWQAGSDSLATRRSPARSRRASGAAWPHCPPRPDGCSCSQRPTRLVTRHWSGAGRSGSASHLRPRPTPTRRGWSRSAHGSGSGIRWCARPSTGRHRPSSGRRSTAHWPRSPIRHSIRIGASGTGRGRIRAGRGHRRRAGALRRPCTARGGLAAAAAFLERAATLTLDPDRRAGRAVAAAQRQVPGGRVRRGDHADRHRGGGPAR